MAKPSEQANTICLTCSAFAAFGIVLGALTDLFMMILIALSPSVAYQR